MIFCTDLSAYGTMLEEDHQVDRMHESLNLFEEIVNNKWFFKTDVILFLNKSDLFHEKIKTAPLTVCFPDYPADNADPEAGIEHIKTHFVRRNKNTERMIYPHITTATDTNNITIVFKAVKGIILHSKWLFLALKNSPRFFRRTEQEWFDVNSGAIAWILINSHCTLHLFLGLFQLGHATANSGQQIHATQLDGTGWHLFLGGLLHLFGWCSTLCSVGLRFGLALSRRGRVGARTVAHWIVLGLVTALGGSSTAESQVLETALLFLLFGGQRHRGQRLILCVI
jgi:hypothetical protein